ncbi:MAG: ECF transporter S component [bacterium]|nr:ECF transporter S component [bacterium]
MTTQKKNNLSVQYLARIAVLAALSTVLFLTLEIPIFGNIYKLDFSNIPVMLAGYSMGLVPAIITLAIKDVLHLLLNGIGSTAGVGDLADFIMTAAFITPAVLLYQRQKSRKTALVGMLLGTVTMALVALAVNAFIMFPFYMSAFHIDLTVVAGMLGADQSSGMLTLLLTTTLPFNLLKGVVICLLTYLIYKPLSPILHVKQTR